MDGAYLALARRVLLEWDCFRPCLCLGLNNQERDRERVLVRMWERGRADSREVTKAPLSLPASCPMVAPSGGNRNQNLSSCVRFQSTSPARVSHERVDKDRLL